jgi:hypothetical protein
MTTVIALTQLIFITIGVVTLKGTVNANQDISSSPYFQFLDKNWPWLYLLPIAWILFAQTSYRINRGLLTPFVAGVAGTIISVICFIFIASVTFFYRRRERRHKHFAFGVGATGNLSFICAP